MTIAPDFTVVVLATAMLVYLYQIGSRFYFVMGFPIVVCLITGFYHVSGMIKDSKHGDV